MEEPQFLDHGRVDGLQVGGGQRLVIFQPRTAAATEPRRKLGFKHQWGCPLHEHPEVLGVGLDQIIVSCHRASIGARYVMRFAATNLVHPTIDHGQQTSRAQMAPVGRRSIAEREGLSAMAALNPQ